MRYTRFLFFLIITISLFVLLVGGCDGGGGGGNSSGQELTRVERVIGPEGGTVEVADHNSPIYGVKLEIPAGALAHETTIFIEETRQAPGLPAGLTSENPIVNFGPDTMFLKDIEITFPIQYIPYSDEEILGAFYWDFDNGKWTVVSPRQVNDYEMIIKTDNFGLCRWGIVLLTEVEAETVATWMEDMFYDWSELERIILEQLEPFISVIEDPENLVYCKNQDAILDFLAFMRQEALQGVTDYLASETVRNECEICDVNHVCYDSTCDASQLISGQPFKWLEKEIQIWWEETFVSVTCPVDLLGPFVGKLVAWAKYQEAIRSLRCDWRCILQNGDFQFYVDLLVGNACSFSIFGILVYRSHVPCI